MLKFSCHNGDRRSSVFNNSIITIQMRDLSQSIIHWLCLMLASILVNCLCTFDTNVSVKSHSIVQLVIFKTSPLYHNKVGAIIESHEMSFGWDCMNRGPVSQQVWHIKEPLLLKAMSTNHIGLNLLPCHQYNGDSCWITEKLLSQL
jgi:hypothetical protein